MLTLVQKIHVDGSLPIGLQTGYVQGFVQLAVIIFFRLEKQVTNFHTKTTARHTAGR